MRFAEVGLQAEGGFRLAPCLVFPRFERLVKMINLCAGGSELGMGEGEVRIERDRLGVKFRRPPIVLEQGVGSLLVGEGAQVKILGVGVLESVCFLTRTFSSGVS